MVREAVCGGRPGSMAGGVLALSLGLNIGPQKRRSGLVRWHSPLQDSGTQQ
jgi:hypothetical protein